MATKLSTDVIDLSGNTEALVIPKGETNSTLEIEYLVVAGGGGGAGNSSGGGGGGAGGLLTGTASFSSNATVTIGSGGYGATLESSGAVADNGGNSVFSTITATGGGGARNTGSGGSSSDGGSGGGASGGTTVGAGSASPTGQGNNGGIGSDPSDIGGGGGGAGSVGQPGGDRSGSTDGQGGAAISNSITGTSVLYAGGGGGGVCDFTFNSTPATAGLGGAGVSGTGGDGGQSGDQGTDSYTTMGGFGVANTGGGGGGGSRSAGSYNASGGGGASGTVILKYPTTNTLTVGSGLYGNYATGTTGLCSWPTSSNGVSLFQLENNITDTCGNSSASWSGTAAYSSTAKFGSYSAEFSGGNGGTAIDTGVDPDASSNWTVSMWMYRTNTSAFDWLFGSFDSSLSNGFGVSFYNKASSGKFDVYIGNGGSYTRTRGGGTSFNKWEHIALTHNSSGSGSTTIYHNGKILTGITLGANPLIGNKTSPENWFIGSGGAWTYERFNGYIDQARFYDTELTAAEIELLYAETASATTGTIGSQTWSKFIGGTGTVSFANATGGRPTSPTEGLMRENTTTGKMEFYDGSLWQEINDTASSYSPSLIPSANFTPVIYTGNGGTQNITTGFNPDFGMFKARNATGPWSLQDSVTGDFYLRSNSTDAAAATSGYNVTSWTTSDTEITVKDDANGAYNINGSPGGLYAGNGTYVGYVWKAGGAATTISGVGTISSDVSANTAAGFSIVKYTGNGSAGATIAHGLGGSPEIVFSKSLDSAYSWNVFSSSLSTNYMMKLNTDGAAFDGSAGTNGGAYTVSNTLLTVIGGASTQNNNNASGDDFIAYCWRSIPGYSKIGFYIGDGNSTGPQIYTGFKPAWLMTKPTISGYWYILDNKRNTSNPRNTGLFPNDTLAEITNTNYNVDFNNTGFQLKNNTIGFNNLGVTYIYMAFSE